MKNHCLLYLNTTLPHGAEIALIAQEKIFKKRITARHGLSERLLPTLDQMLRSEGKKLDALTAIFVVAVGGSFTALRAGVVTANALSYALKIPVHGSATALQPKDLVAFSEAKKDLRRVLPTYAAPPHITRPKKERA